MNTFPSWRDVGQAMRWARKQHGAALYHHVRSHDFHKVRANEWAVGDVHAIVEHSPGWSAVNMTVSGPDVHLEMNSDDVRSILSVLASVELLPVTFSSGYRAGAGIGYKRGRGDLSEELLAIQAQYGEVTS